MLVCLAVRHATLSYRGAYKVARSARGHLRCCAMASAGGKLRQPTIIDCVVVDHRNTLALLDQFDGAAAQEDKAAMEKVLGGLSLEIMLHSHAEETVLYPFIEKRMGEEGKEFSQHSLKEHKKLEKELLEALHKRKEGGSDLEDLVKQIRKDFEHHLHDEEDEFLPKLEKQATEEELAELAPHFTKAKASARLSPTDRQ